MITLIELGVVATIAIGLSIYILITELKHPTSYDRLMEENKELKKINAELLKKTQILEDKIKEMTNEI